MRETNNMREKREVSEEEINDLTGGGEGIRKVKRAHESRIAFMRVSRRDMLLLAVLYRERIGS